MAGQPYYNAINGQSYGYAMPAQGYMAPTYPVPQQPAQTPYMIQVDGEMAAVTQSRCLNGTEGVIQCAEAQLPGLS